MGALKRDQGHAKAHPAVAAVLLTVVLLIFLLFPLALYANVVALVDGYRASHGQSGTPGTATVVAAVESRGGQVCTAAFTPDGGGPAVEVRVELPGRCEVGQEVEARLMEARPSPFRGYDEPRAWAAGADDWAVYIALVVLFGLLSLPLLLLVVMVVAAVAKGIAKRVDRPRGPPSL